MKWKKLGQIFNPDDYCLPHRCQMFAKSPQTVVFNDFVRVYFSSTEKEGNGKLLSRVLFVDFDLGFKKILKVANSEVIPLGKLGTFDEHGIFPFSVCKTNDKIIAYTTGWNRKYSVSVDAAIGFAESTDGGISFQKPGDGPILAPCLNEPFLVGDAFVGYFNGNYHMWYIYGQKWLKEKNETSPQRVYKITSAVSKNGIHWERNGLCIIPDVLGDDECQALPCVIKIGNIYHMYFCYRHAFGFRDDKSKSYKLGYAYSSDLKNWIRDDSRVGISLSDEGWDSEMMCYPHVFHCDGKIYMLYNGNQFGRTGFGLAVLT